MCSKVRRAQCRRYAGRQTAARENETRKKREKKKYEHSDGETAHATNDGIVWRVEKQSRVTDSAISH